MDDNLEPDHVVASGLTIGRLLHDFVNYEALPGTGISSERFWNGLREMVDRFGPRNRELLRIRGDYQAALAEWHKQNPGPITDLDGYQRFLEELGYLSSSADNAVIDTERVDPELTTIAGPQLVVPVTNARYALNAVNARWGSLYDALYGTDALGTKPTPGPYDPVRGADVVAWGRRFLDDVVALQEGSHADASAYAVSEGQLTVSLGATTTTLRDGQAFAGYTGNPDSPTSVLLRNNGLHLQLMFDSSGVVGKSDLAAIQDIIVESAISVIVDCEDSVAAVDAEDKAHAYRNWLGLMKGDLTEEVTKADTTFVRKLADDKKFTDPDGAQMTLAGRSVMLVRNVGHLMTTPAVLDPEGYEIPEGMVDTMVTSLCALHDLTVDGGNTRTGSIYIVKPKMHGPDEVAFADELFGHAEGVLGLKPNTIKMGVMDEERRTSVNLAACIQAAKHRVVFINTGFLDRTGDEIHSIMTAGPVVRKSEMKNEAWITAYEDSNVDTGFQCGLKGRAQIGKGMWAAPDLMNKMLEEKIGHVEAGATCAWVPSPTAATLHATHYHYVDVHARQAELSNGGPRAKLADLLTPPLAIDPTWDKTDIQNELDNNAQGILGYVVRWVDQGVGCSKVPDINNVGLMEDRATCRISAQHMANWLLHGVTTVEQVTDTMKRMAAVVDAQNAQDLGYTSMAPNFDGPAFRAAVALVIEGAEQPSGYTEPILHEHRRERKRQLRANGATA